MVGAVHGCVLRRRVRRRDHQRQATVRTEQRVGDRGTGDHAAVLRDEQVDAVEPGDGPAGWRAGGELQGHPRSDERGVCSRRSHGEGEAMC